ncbi:hypothetical protein [Stenotrophomonas maltophilia]|uniref:hypothetical protein n=1 Tax=Stenotrophomonas maltophilia TaxID=40324 RepID=UPI000A63AB4C|nr:hypothetical protein [Stenotrophomonas maltophilia]
MRNMIALASVLLGATLSTDAYAYEYSIQCETCVTDAQFAARARDLQALNGNGSGFFYVYNLGANVVQKWWVNGAASGGDGGSGGGRPRMASSASSTSSQSPVESHVRVEVDKAHKLYVIGGNSLRPIYNVPIEHLSIPATNGKSTYDVLLDNNLKAQIESSLGDTNTLNSIVNADILSSMIDIAQNATNVLGLKEKSFLLFRVVMSDGTYMDYALQIEDTTADAKEESARTSTGQLIPASQSNIQGAWNGSVENLAPMVDHLIKLGVPVENVGVGSYVTEIVCTSSKCSIRRIQR